ncbi:MAG: hypothetical protein WA957_00635 [Alteraurantiacibacter sp.]
MNAPSINFGSFQSCSIEDASCTSLRWAALTKAGQVVAALAGVEAEMCGRDVRNFPSLMRDVQDWRRELADNGCADLAAVMEVGISALLTITEQKGDCKPAALALWREFAAARSAMLALLPPAGQVGLPQRSSPEATAKRV